MLDYDPYTLLSPKPGFTLTSESLADGDTMPAAQVAAGAHRHGRDLSPQLSWSGFPAGTRSFAVTMFDPDAPTASGFWHWVVANIPATVTSLAEGAGDSKGSKGLPAGALTLKNDAGYPGYMGSAPPAGDGPHRYMVVVHAVDVAALDVRADATPAVLGFNLNFHGLARARLTGVFEAK
ncbi:YbhB/YbcL family Raf kinase inhibitor-like protein [Specibacter cremeus]|uniref:YbhB/YbcL family Raf kinase inhibitor-like protein n=1 Tax=Specibacter cremeus TaxID=1629051 RepID=UPI000F7880A3|nr:YbhB/YbcL family Raf kinase inhibitor-like protein [Specibacter cremeus]